MKDDKQKMILTLVLFQVEVREVSGRQSALWLQDIFKPPESLVPVKSAHLVIHIQTIYKQYKDIKRFISVAKEDSPCFASSCRESKLDPAPLLSVKHTAVSEQLLRCSAYLSDCCSSVSTLATRPAEWAQTKDRTDVPDRNHGYSSCTSLLILWQHKMRRNVFYVGCETFIWDLEKDCSNCLARIKEIDVFCFKTNEKSASWTVSVLVLISILLSWHYVCVPH